MDTDVIKKNTKKVKMWNERVLVFKKKVELLFIRILNKNKN